MLTSRCSKRSSVRAGRSWRPDETTARPNCLARRSGCGAGRCWLMSRCPRRSSPPPSGRPSSGSTRPSCALRRTSPAAGPPRWWRSCAAWSGTIPCGSGCGRCWCGRSTRPDGGRRRSRRTRWRAGRSPRNSAWSLEASSSGCTRSCWRRMRRRRPRQDRRRRPARRDARPPFRVAPVRPTRRVRARAGQTPAERRRRLTPSAHWARPPQPSRTPLPMPASTQSAAASPRRGPIRLARSRSAPLPTRVLPRPPRPGWARRILLPGRGRSFRAPVSSRPTSGTSPAARRRSSSCARCCSARTPRAIRARCRSPW